MSASIAVLLVGPTGKMGREIIAAASRCSDVRIVGGLVSEESATKGKRVPGIEMALWDMWQPEFKAADVIVDFSSREGTIVALEGAFQHRIPLLVGTTGLGEELTMFFSKVAEVVPVVRASNTSIGLNILLRLVREAAAMAGDSVDIEIVEAHHRGKKDAPSGTALSIAEAISLVRSLKIVTDRSGPRSGDEIGIHAVRGGDVVGEHTVSFLANGERLEVAHRVSNRSVFADGALWAAHWLVRQHRGGQRGLFSMADVLGGDLAGTPA